MDLVKYLVVFGIAITLLVGVHGCKHDTAQEIGAELAIENNTEVVDIETHVTIFGTYFYKKCNFIFCIHLYLYELVCLM